MSDPLINVYTCQECGGHTVTVDVDEGVTPFMIRCRVNAKSESDGYVKGECNGMAYSSFYPRGPKPKHIGEPKWEWFKPTDAELVARYKGDVLAGMHEHVGKGGLVLRRRTNREPITHERVRKGS